MSATGQIWRQAVDFKGGQIDTNPRHDTTKNTSQLFLLLQVSVHGLSQSEPILPTLMKCAMTSSYLADLVAILLFDHH